MLKLASIDAGNTTRQQLNLHRRSVMNRPIHLLSSPKISKKIDKTNYLSIDLFTIKLHEKDYVVAFDGAHELNAIKQHVHYQYDVSSVVIEDIAYYLMHSECGLCLVDSLNSTLMYVNSDAIGKHSNHIQVEKEKFN
jgi:hypothetical protein